MASLVDSLVEPIVHTVYGEKGLEQIMKESDYVVIAAPLTPATNGMVSKTQLDFMKPTSVLINVGRGEIVDENALITCLVLYYN